MINETLRYLGITAPSEADRRLAEECLERLKQASPPRYIWRLFPVSREEDGVALTGTAVRLPGRLADTMLERCDRAALLAVTLGEGAERLLRREALRDMTRAAVLDAAASALVEEGCDRAEKEIAAALPGKYLTDRFSPGYGDLPLTVQPCLLNTLDAGKRLGITLTDSLLMNPTKSVTAVIGIGDTPQPARIRGCGHCAMRDRCAYRKGGRTCHE